MPELPEVQTVVNELKNDLVADGIVHIKPIWPKVLYNFKPNDIIIDGKENLIHSNDHFTAVVGLENVVVVHTDDATLVVHKEKVEEIKTLVKKLVDSDYKVLL